ncbi:MAG TPA: hypothetical protein VJH92_02250 [Candidatus Nanoarchaeia archaeon]|nr:hypothetical protein [Candidatus Nanoarchaeia archaeon]
MDKENFYKIAAVVLLLSILFTPQSSDIWLLFMVPAIVFGILWFRKLD